MQTSTKLAHNRKVSWCLWSLNLSQFLFTIWEVFLRCLNQERCWMMIIIIVNVRTLVEKRIRLNLNFVLLFALMFLQKVVNTAPIESIFMFAHQVVYDLFPFLNYLCCPGCENLCWNKPVDGFLPFQIRSSSFLVLSKR